MSTRLVILGASGRLGRAIARAAASHAMQVVALGRPGAGARIRSALGELASQVSVAEVDLSNVEAIAAALGDAPIVISTVNGAADVVLGVQSAVLEGARRAHAARFVPSTFSIDLFRLDDGDNVFLDLRRRFAERLQDAGVPYTHVLNGSFAEVLLGPHFGLFDFNAGVARYWGDIAQPLDLTTVADTARFTLAAALDPRAANRAVGLVGAKASVDDIARAWEARTDRVMTRQRSGSIDELAALIAAKRAGAESPLDFVFLQYLWSMASGKAEIRERHDDWYPEIQPASIETLVARATGADGPRGRTGPPA